MNNRLIIVLLQGLLQVYCSIHSRITLECPHYGVSDAEYVWGKVKIGRFAIDDIKHIQFENTCPFSITSHNVQTGMKIISWTEKETHDSSAVYFDKVATHSEKTGDFKSLCGSVNYLTYPFKSGNSYCLNLHCNQTVCDTEVIVFIKAISCVAYDSCVLYHKDIKVQLNFRKTHCVKSVLHEKKCFQPDFTTGFNPKLHMRFSLPSVCIFMPSDGNAEGTKEIVGQDSCADIKLNGWYSCIVGHYSMIFVHSNGKMRQIHLNTKFRKNPQGDDHSELRSGSTHIVGYKNMTTISNKVNTLAAFKGATDYSSLFYNIQNTDKKPLLLAGYTPTFHWRECGTHLIPAVWTSHIDVWGTIIESDECNIFCTLSGPGASCEAFSPTGIFLLNSTTCLIPHTHRFKGLGDQITFICQRVDTDLEFYCNGRHKIIRTKTLIIGQCIQTFTSFFSLFPGVAHSLAVELCVPGFHGFITVCIVSTFCFGWLWIPGLTWLILQFLKFVVMFVSTNSVDQRFKQILQKIKAEYRLTIGDTSCDFCKHECQTSLESDSHILYCKQGKCPYCLNDIYPSPLALQEHYKVCMLTDRFTRQIKEKILNVEVKPHSGLYKRLCVFQYKNRCYIFTIWIFLLVFQMLVWAASAEVINFEKEWNDNVHGIGSEKLITDLELDFSIPSSSGFTYTRNLEGPMPNQKVHFALKLSRQKTRATIQKLGHWVDARWNIRTVFHCYGACSKFEYPWKSATCNREKDFEYQTGWGCNPGDCPGINTGCTACGLYLDKPKSVATVVKLIQLDYEREVCIQIGTHSECKKITGNDCLSTHGVKVCLLSTTVKLTATDTLVFFGPLQQGAVVFKNWCTSTCSYGDPGDIMLTENGEYNCPDFTGSFERTCRFGQTPVCEYNGNNMGGYKRYLATKDSFFSINMTEPIIDKTRLEWFDPDSTSRDHINVQVSKDVDFENLGNNPCRLTLKTTGIEGAWGSETGFALTCKVSLLECNSFVTMIKACDKAMCYGAYSTTLQRGDNTITIQGRGGHSGSSFKCCHNDDCSTTGMLADAPHLSRLKSQDGDNSEIYSDGANECRITCWFNKTSEWVMGMLSGNWLVILVLVGIMLFSVFLFCFFCPAKTHQA
uniref:M polyprotein n=2 Tax=Imjin virus TaxID=467989 RepID=A0A286QJJ5_9VIRU|nr:glycoprotein [Imjin virus]ARI46081.1 glycoprotein [Imjin virus]